MGASVPTLSFMNSQLKQQLKSQYQIDTIINLEDYLTLPIPALYTTLEPLKKDVYNNNYKIVFYIFCKVEQSVIVHLQKVLSVLDIPEFFVLVVSNQTTVKEYLKQDINFFYHDTAVTPAPLSITNFNIPESICVNPWINVLIDNNGKFAPCCEYRPYLDNECQEVMYANSYTLKQVHSGTAMEQIRQDFLSGKRPNGCNSCFSVEDLGKVSKRRNDNYVFRNIINTIDWNKKTTDNIQSLDIKLGNTCNLSCQICTPEASSVWADQVSKSNELRKKYFITNETKSIWTDEKNSIFWDGLKETYHSIRYLDFAGGEPLLIKKHFSVLQYFVDQGVSNNISLHYNTNGTIFPEAAVDLWKQFKQVKISFSIDNVGQQFEYERYGADWNMVRENIDKFQSLDPLKFEFDLYCVLSALNVHAAGRVFDFACSKNMNVEYSILSEPPEFSMDVLPAKAKQFAIDILNSHDSENFKIKIQPIVLKLQSDQSSLTIDDFWNRVNLLDQHRGHRFADVYPELMEYLK